MSSAVADHRTSSRSPLARNTPKKTLPLTPVIRAAELARSRPNHQQFIQDLHATLRASPRARTLSRSRYELLPALRILADGCRPEIKTCRVLLLGSWLTRGRRGLAIHRAGGRVEHTRLSLGNAGTKSNLSKSSLLGATVRYCVQQPNYRDDHDRPRHMEQVRTL